MVVKVAMPQQFKLKVVPSLYYGEEVSEEEAEKLTAEIEELYPDMDVDAHMGGQPIYYYVLAVE